ncbi:MAG TPA: hypothetical protein VNU72_10170, partial [Puia sp.]|nr:hypothetical protein [Puia sp.]
MFALTEQQNSTAFSVRPVNKRSDHSIVYEIFRQEFGVEGDFADTGLWKVYNKMDTEGIFGAYLVLEGEQVLFLLEIYRPTHMDLSADFTFGPDDIGIYCFYLFPDATALQPALVACIDALLDTHGVERIITAVGYPIPGETKVTLLENAGFRPLPASTDRLSIYECT